VLRLQFLDVLEQTGQRSLDPGGRVLARADALPVLPERLADGARLAVGDAAHRSQVFRRGHEVLVQRIHARRDELVAADRPDARRLAEDGVDDDGVPNRAAGGVGARRGEGFRQQRGEVGVFPQQLDPDVAGNACALGVLGVHHQLLEPVQDAVDFLVAHLGAGIFNDLQGAETDVHPLLARGPGLEFGDEFLDRLQIGAGNGQEQLLDLTLLGGGQGHLPLIGLYRHRLRRSRLGDGIKSVIQVVQQLID